MKKKIEKTAKDKTKVSAEKEIKSPVTKGASVGKKEMKKSATKAVDVIDNTTKTSILTNTKSRADRKAKSEAKQRVVPHIITHSKDRHFIPAHNNAGVEPLHNSKREEKIFHNKEEVALHQENQKVKSGMVSKAGIKRIFNSQGRR